MNLPRYAEYKDSGVAWLGEVPAHWQINRLKFGLRLLTDKTATRTNPVALENIESWSGRFLATDTEFQGEGTAFEQGDVLFGKLRPYLAKVLLAESSGEAVGDFHVLRPATGVVPRFAQYQLLSREFIGVVDGSTFGSKMPRASWEFLANLPLVLPDAEEQSAIAAFLDRETRKIDALIAEQEKLLTLLAEKRQATISHAVTRGLTNLPGADLNAAFGGGPKGEGKDSPSNPNAPMKDSGVPWLGEVPAHWEVTRLKFVASVQSGIAKGKDNQGKETITVPYLRVANVQDGHLALEQVTMIDIEPEQLNRYRLQVGDVLMNEGGDFDKLGRGAIWNGEIDDCIHQNHVFAVRPHAVSPRWLNQIAGSRYAQFYFMGRSKQSTNLASISSTNIMELPVLLPPVEEQVAILAFLDDENTRLDALYDSSTLAISLLKERRSALIAAAVTGKIDVRNTSQTTEDASA